MKVLNEPNCWKSTPKVNLWKSKWSIFTCQHWFSDRPSRKSASRNTKYALSLWIRRELWNEWFAIPVLIILHEIDFQSSEDPKQKHFRWNSPLPLSRAFSLRFVLTEHQRGLTTEATRRQSARRRYHLVFVENDEFADDRDETFNKIG